MRRESIIQKLKDAGRLPDALSHLLGQDIPPDRTSSVRCLNPAAHKNGDRNPSAVVKPDHGRVDCSICGGKWGILDLAIHFGEARDRRGAAEWLERQFLNGPVNVPSKKKRRDYRGMDARFRSQLSEFLAMETRAKFRKLEAALRELGCGYGPGDPAKGWWPVLSFPVHSPEGELTGLVLRAIESGAEVKSRSLGSGFIGIPALSAKPDALAAFAAGEKDMLTGLHAVPEWAWITPSCGEGQSLEPLADVLKGRSVALIYDVDAPGIKAAKKAAATLSRLAASVTVVRLPLKGTADSKDLTDFIREHGAEAPGLLRKLAAPPAEGEHREGFGVGFDDFRALMPEHAYIFVPARQLWPAASVNSRLPRVVIGTDEDGKAIKISAARWLDEHQPVEQLTWGPGLPLLIEDRLISEGGWIDHPGCSIFNLYRPPSIKHGDPKKAGPWLDHIAKVYPDDAPHIIQWLAHRVQRPGEKINHALVLGGAQGIGKDTLLEPPKHGVGPWNFSEITPAQLLGRFNGFTRSVILRVNEARDLGDVNRYAFYDHLKNYTAAPPDVLRVDEKNRHEYAVRNVCGVIITSNHKADGLYLPPDDRRHFVAWSELTKDDFERDYWNRLWNWYEDEEGFQRVAAYLATLDLTFFDAKAPPPKTPAFWEIVDAGRAPEDAELADVLDQLGNPDAVTLTQLSIKAASSFSEWLTDRKNARRVPHRMEAAGYAPVRNDAQKDGRWKVQGRNVVIYAKRALPVRDRIAAAQRLAEGGEA